MHSTQSLHPGRPAGPRLRSASPSPALALPDVQPLNIRRPNGASPRPKLKLPTIDFSQVEGGAFTGEYTGGGNSVTPHVNSGTMSPGDLTVRPDQTVSPRPRAPSKKISMDDIRQTVRKFDEWSDDYLEDLARLGEGAGGAVYKVKDKRTGLVMARKTITTLEAPMKQLMREINIISSTSHQNIIHFYGAYISPSSSEVKVLMEYCEGGSLESVGKRLKETDKRVTENVAGRLAEGVSIIPLLSWLRRSPDTDTDAFRLADPAGPCLPAQAEDHPPRHQAAKHPPHARRHREALRLRCLGRACQLHGRHLHGHESLHGGTSSLRADRLRVSPVLICAAAGTAVWARVHHPIGRLVYGHFAARAGPEPVPLPQRSRRDRAHDVHYPVRGALPFRFPSPARLPRF